MEEDIRLSTVENRVVYNYDVKDFDETFKIPVKVLNIIGIRFASEDSPFFRFCRKVYFWIEFVNLVIATCLELIAIVQTARGGSFQDALEIFRMLPCALCIGLGIAKTFSIVHYRPIYENLIAELRDLWPQGSVTEEQHLIIRKSVWQTKFLVKIYYWCNNSLIVLFLAPPFIEILKRAAGDDVPLILPFVYWFPFDPLQDPYYGIVLAFQIWHTLLTVWFILVGDLLFYIFLSHISTQFDLLAYRIRNFVYVPVDKQLIEEYSLGIYSKNIAKTVNRDMENFTNTQKERIYEKEIAEIVSRHQTLIRLSEDVEHVFSFIMLFNFSNTSIVICFCGFCCVVVEKWNELLYKSFLITVLSLNFLLCWHGQRLIDSSKGVADALYNSGWYNVSKKISKSIVIMLHRAQKEVRVTTFGFSNVSLTSYTTIIKTSWSYLTLLLNIYERQ